MDDATKRAYIRTRLIKAREDVDSARSVIASGFLRVSVNRAYYAVFHVASAALLWIDIERSRHLGVQSAFGEFLVKPGLIEPAYGRLYARAREAREEQDYDLDAPPLTMQDAESLVADAERFVARSEAFLIQARALP